MGVSLVEKDGSNPSTVQRRRIPDMDFFERYFWVLVILFALFSSRGPREIRDRAREDPELGREHNRLWRNMFLWKSMPWAIMGVGILSGSVPDLLHYFRPQDMNPFVLAFLGSLLLTWTVALYWAFHGGAEKIARHQLVSVYYIGGGRPFSADQIKTWLVGGAFFIVMALVYMFILARE